MQVESIFILLFAVATAVAIAVQRLAVPYTVALVFTGLVLGILHVFEAPHLTKALLFNVFLPGLLFGAAFHAHPIRPKALASLRQEYEQKIEHANAALDAMHIENEQLHAEGLQRARQHLLFVE